MVISAFGAQDLQYLQKRGINGSADGFFTNERGARKSIQELGKICKNPDDQAITAFIKQSETPQGFHLTPERIHTFILGHFDPEKASNDKLVASLMPFMQHCLRGAPKLLAAIKQVVECTLPKSDEDSYFTRYEQLTRLLQYVYAHMPRWQEILASSQEGIKCLKITRKVSGLTHGIRIGPHKDGQKWHVFLKLFKKQAEGAWKRVLFPLNPFSKKQLVFGVLHKHKRTDKDIALLRSEGHLQSLAVSCSHVVHGSVVKVAKWIPSSKAYICTYEHVAEKMDSGSLRDKLTQVQSYSGEIKKEIAVGIATGVYELHSLPTPIIHEDIKPANCLLYSMPGGKIGAKVGDLGIAREYNKPHTGLHGTYRYLSPQKIRQLSDRDRFKDDIWALGLVLYELLHGTPPEKLKKASDIDAIKVLLADSKGFLGRKPPKNGFATLIWSMLSHESSDRPTSKQVVERLRALPPSHFRL